MGKMTSQLKPSAVADLGTGARWIPVALCMWLALGNIATSTAQPIDSAPAARGTDARQDARPRGRSPENGSTLDAVDAEAEATLRVITRRDGTQVMGQVIKVVPHEPITVHTAVQGDVVIAWDDIRRIEELRSGPASAAKPVHQQPFEPIRIAPPLPPQTGGILRSTGGVTLTVVGSVGAAVGALTLAVAGSFAALESAYGGGLLGGGKTDFGPAALGGAVSLGIGAACLGVGVYLLTSNQTRTRVTSRGKSAAEAWTAGLHFTSRGLAF